MIEYNLFDWETYLNNYDDLKKVFKTKDQAWRHWIKYGKKEGRTANNIINKIPDSMIYEKYPNFNFELYKTFNSEKIISSKTFINHLENDCIYSLESFYRKYPNFNYHIYRKVKDIKKGITEVQTIINWYKNERNFDFLESVNLSNYIRKKILIYPHMKYDKSNGGIVVQYYLAEKLDLMGEQVRLFDRFKSTQNDFNINYYNNDFVLDDNTMVIYCEGIKENPLNAKNVTRWLLSELGMNVRSNSYKKWGHNDLVYYFNYERKIYDKFKTNNDIYKSMSLIYIDNNICNYNINERNGYCYTIRKGKIDQNNIYHPVGSFEITRKHSQKDYIEFFNKYKYFISYDPLTFLNIISALCGCISIIYPLNNVSKKEWYRTTIIARYLEENNEDLYGIAYGNSIEEISFASTTIDKVKEQWEKILNYISIDIENFVKDININNNNNIIKNIFY